MVHKAHHGRLIGQHENESYQPMIKKQHKVFDLLVFHFDQSQGAEFWKPCGGVCVRKGYIFNILVLRDVIYGSIKKNGPRIVRRFSASPFYNTEMSKGFLLSKRL